MSSEYIPDWRIFEYEARFAAGDREAGERLVRFYESEIASMAVRRDRLLRAMAAADERPAYVEVDDEYAAIEA